MPSALRWAIQDQWLKSGHIFVSDHSLGISSCQQIVRTGEQTLDLIRKQVLLGLYDEVHQVLKP